MTQMTPASRSVMADDGSAKYSRSYKSRIAWSERNLQTLKPKMAAFKAKIKAFKMPTRTFRTTTETLLMRTITFDF